MLGLLVTAVLAQDYYPLGEGYSWTYQMASGDVKQETVKKVAGKEKVGGVDCFVVEDSGMGGDFKKLMVSVDKEGVTVHKMRREISRSFPWLKFPLQKNTRWGAELKGAGKIRKLALDFVVEDEEEVVVPAGTYKALRVRVVCYEELAPDCSTELTLWYAPDVGEVKREVKHIRGEATQELTYSLLRFDKGK